MLVTPRSPWAMTMSLHHGGDSELSNIIWTSSCAPSTISHSNLSAVDNNQDTANSQMLPSGNQIVLTLLLLTSTINLVEITINLNYHSLTEQDCSERCLSPKCWLLPTMHHSFRSMTNSRQLLMKKTRLCESIWLQPWRDFTQWQASLTTVLHTLYGPQT